MRDERNEIHEGDNVLRDSDAGSQEAGADKDEVTEWDTSSEVELDSNAEGRFDIEVELESEHGPSDTDNVAASIASDVNEGIEASVEKFARREDFLTAEIRAILQRYCAPYSDTRKLKDMGAANLNIRARIAHDIDQRWPNLNPRFGVRHVIDTDTLTTLTERVREMFV